MMRENVSLPTARALAASATLLLATLAAASAGLAAAPPPAGGSISIKNYLPELQRLTQAADWVGLERASRQALTALSDRNGPNSVDAAVASYWLASAFQGEGRYAEAELLYQRALTICEKALGANDPIVATVLNDLAAFYHAQGQYPKAEPLYQRALEIREKTLGPNHSEVANSLNNLATLYQAQGQYAKAEPLYQRALDIRQKTLGPDHPDVATSLNNLALLYWKQGQYFKAEPLYRRALEIREKALEPNDPQVARGLNDLALLYESQGQYAKAEPLYQRALEIREKALGPNHPDVATSLNNLASLYGEQSQNAKAEPLYQRALEIREKVLGPNHPDVATSLNNLAGLYDGQGQNARAEALLQRALDIEEKALGPDHPSVAATLKNLASSYWAQGQNAKAEPLYQRALGIEEKVLGPTHTEVANSLNNLASVYQAQGLYTKAEPLYQQALGIAQKALGPAHPDVAQSLDNLGGLYYAQRQYAKAARLFQQALDIWEKALGPDSRYVARSLSNLAAVNYVQAQYTKAELLYQRVLGIEEKALPPNHPDVAKSLNGLAFVYLSQSQYAKAEPLLQRALGIQEKALGPDHPDTVTARENLAFSEVLQGRFEQATGHYRVACSARTSAVGSGTGGEATQAARTSISKCSTFHALSLWNWSAQGGGTASADRPDALKVEAFAASQRAVHSAAGTAMARSAALIAANSAGIGPEARDYEVALLERARLDEEYAKAAGTIGHQSTEKLQGLAKARDEVVSRIKRLEADLQSKAPLYWDYRAPAPVSVAALQASEGPDSSLLRENEALIVFLVPPGEDRGLVFAVSKREVAWARIGMTGNDLQAAVIRLRAEIDPEGYALSDFRGVAVVGTSSLGVPQASDSGSAAFDRHLAYEIHQVLMGNASIQKVIQDKAVLLFVPSGPLTALPPGLLVTADPSGGREKDIDPAALRTTAWLLRSKAVALLPAVSSLRTLRQILPTGHAGTTDPLLALADPAFAPLDRAAPSKRAAGIPRAFKAYFRDGIPLAEAMESLPALPGTRIEAEALRRTLGAPSSSLLLGRNASKAQLMARNGDGRLARVRVLEFATHGLVAGDISDVAEPALVLAAGSRPEDSLLLASEASTLRLKADWVLLSACNTASPDAPQAEGLSGLARAFFYAGARSLLVSHWLVRDDVAPILIPAVLKAERDDPHLSRAEALRKASLAILDDPHLDAAGPAAWAAFTLIGEAGRD